MKIVECQETDLKDAPVLKYIQIGEYKIADGGNQVPVIWKHGEIPIALDTEPLHLLGNLKEQRRLLVMDLAGKYDEVRSNWGSYETPFDLQRDLEAHRYEGPVRELTPDILGTDNYDAVCSLVEDIHLDTFEGVCKGITQEMETKINAGLTQIYALIQEERRKLENE